MPNSKVRHGAGVVTVALWNRYHCFQQIAIKCRQEGSLNSHKIALWVSNGDVSVTSGQTFHFIKERCETRGEELCQVTDLAGSRSKIGTQLSPPQVAGAPPSCDATSPGPSETFCFPLALHVIFVDAGAHTISRPGWPLPRRYPLAPRPLPSPGLPPARSLTCCELGGSGLALVGSADRADPHLVQGAWPQGLYRVLAQGRLQPEGGLPTFPTHQAVLQENEIDFGSRWGPLHEGHGVGDISN